MVKEVHNQPVWLDAESEGDAIERVAEGEGDTCGQPAQYNYTLDNDTWDATTETSPFIIRKYKKLN